LKQSHGEPLRSIRARLWVQSFSEKERTLSERGELCER
jgi:hypothetical protein